MPAPKKTHIPTGSGLEHTGLDTIALRVYTVPSPMQTEEDCKQKWAECHTGQWKESICLQKCKLMMVGRELWALRQLWKHTPFCRKRFQKPPSVHCCCIDKCKVKLYHAKMKSYLLVSQNGCLSVHSSKASICDGIGNMHICEGTYAEGFERR